MNKSDLFVVDIISSTTFNDFQYLHARRWYKNCMKRIDEKWIFDELTVCKFENLVKMATGGKFLTERRTEKLLSRILPEVSSSTEEENDRNPSPPPFKVPDGLRSLLNELSKEVHISLN